MAGYRVILFSLFYGRINIMMLVLFDSVFSCKTKPVFYLIQMNQNPPVCVLYGTSAVKLCEWVFVCVCYGRSHIKLCVVESVGGMILH